MTSADFERLVPFLKALAPERIEAARMSLTQSAEYSDQQIAEKFGVTRQAVGNSVKRVWEVYEEWQESQAAATGKKIPRGWVEVAVPPTLLNQVLALVAESKAAPKKKGKSAEQ
jgi:predicted transcriptional regulator